MINWSSIFMEKMGLRLKVPSISSIRKLVHPENARPISAKLTTSGTIASKSMVGMGKKVTGHVGAPTTSTSFKSFKGVRPR
jgi:hypothetical protein